MRLTCVDAHCLSSFFFFSFCRGTKASEAITSPTRLQAYTGKTRSRHTHKHTQNTHTHTHTHTHTQTHTHNIFCLQVYTQALYTSNIFFPSVAVGVAQRTSLNDAAIWKRGGRVCVGCLKAHSGGSSLSERRPSVARRGGARVKGLSGLGASSQALRRQVLRPRNLTS
jgi:hypothetical protein